MEKKLTVEELVKTLRCCSGDINSCAGCQLECGQIYAQAVDALETTTIERDGYREQLSAVLAENTRLAEQLESLRTIFYEVTGSVPSKASQPVPLPEPPKEESHE